jgi:hypothetical protein
MWDPPIFLSPTLPLSSLSQSLSHSSSLSHTGRRRRQVTSLVLERHCVLPHAPQAWMWGRWSRAGRRAEGARRARLRRLRPEHAFNITPALFHLLAWKQSLHPASASDHRLFTQLTDAECCCCLCRPRTGSNAALPPEQGKEKAAAPAPGRASRTGARRSSGRTSPAARSGLRRRRRSVSPAAADL